MEDQNKNMKKLKRSKTDRVIAGVFGGMGEYFQIDPVIFRLAGVLVFFLSGFIPFIIAYIIAIVIIPENETGSETTTSPPVHKKWWFWLLILILLFLFLSPLLAFLGFKNFSKTLDFQEWQTFITEKFEETQLSERTHIAERVLPGPKRSSVNEYLEENIITANFDGEIFAEYHEFGRGVGELFIWAYVAELYELDEDLKTSTATSLPLVITFSEEELTGHHAPRDGSYYSEDIKEMFPPRHHNEILYFQSIHKETLNGLIGDVENKARLSL